MRLDLYKTLYICVGLGVATSCGLDEGPEDVTVALNKGIGFVTSLPGVETRTNYYVERQLLKTGISVSAFCPEDDPQTNGILNIHCEDAIAEEDVDGIFRSPNCRWPGNRDEEDGTVKDGHLKFFAFHPSRTIMKQSAKVGNECFIYSNQTIKDASGVKYDYRLTKFRVAPDISQQVDFITAIGEGNKTEHLYSDIKLKFEHQLCGVSVGVWGDNNLYDIEIAGVRIGGIVTETDFNLSTEIPNAPESENSIGSWIITDKSLRGYVDYVYTEKDKVVTVNATNTNTKDKAVSIMGNGGKAMVIPYSYNAWDYQNDRTNQGKGAYISVLLRMTQRDGDHHRIFPSTDPQSEDYIVYLSVRKSDGPAMKRLAKNGNIFGTSTKYHLPDTEELRHYGWPAVPAKLEWKAGYTYYYVLDYSKGVGVHDPADHNPAIAIINWDGVIDVLTPGTESQWGNGETIKYGGWGANTNNTAPDGTVWWK